MKKINKIAHLTSAHLRYDIRIFVKECRSLAQKGYDVSLVVADGRGDEVIDGVKIYDVGAKKGRLHRMIFSTRKVYKKAKELKCDIYHFHDPELIPTGLKLRKLGKKVIYDIHEDLPRQIITKPYLPAITRKPLAKIIEKYEDYAAKRFDRIITATPFIRDRFIKSNISTIDINNFPIIGEFHKHEVWDFRRNEVTYVGGISNIRGIYQMVDALQYITVDAKLNLIGSFYDHSTLEKVKQSPGWKKVIYHGTLSREQVSIILSQSKIGIIIVLNVPNGINAQPNKMFEYMSAGLPIITSNFPLWKEIVHVNKCGITVNPEDPKEIAKAIDKLLSDDVLANQMGENGKISILQKYNWQKEEEKLMNLYNNIF